MGSLPVSFSDGSGSLGPLILVRFFLFQTVDRSWGGVMFIVPEIQIVRPVPAVPAKIHAIRGQAENDVKNKCDEHGPPDGPVHLLRQKICAQAKGDKCHA
ncbi:protein of unknown function [Kyrpidia spormannii]|uniref:Uncharacterized protein n=1 Tax=Kyrpidia spormannii TaxID=2055160 RepID=A0ACA8Z6D7_9BACL|nr:protein of unknown function [Kyrpidia spormannii]